MTEQLAASREAERELPALGEPRAEDAADRDPRLRGGARRRRVRPRRGGADRSRVEAGRLERLVRDLLDLARMNRTEFSVRREPVDLAETAREAVGAPRGRGARVRRRAAARPGPRRWVEADHDRLLQVASNLVENALRETPAGGAVDGHAPSRRSSIVADTGPGIPAERPRARVRALLPLRQGRQGPPGRQRARARDRQAARDGDGRRRAGRERARRDDVHGLATAAASRCRRPRSRRP